MCVVNVSFYANSVSPNKYFNGRSERKSLKFTFKNYTPRNRRFDI